MQVFVRIAPPVRCGWDAEETEKAGDSGRLALGTEHSSNEMTLGDDFRI